MLLQERSEALDRRTIATFERSLTQKGRGRRGQLRSVQSKHISTARGLKFLLFASLFATNTGKRVLVIFNINNTDCNIFCPFHRLYVNTKPFHTLWKRHLQNDAIPSLHTMTGLPLQEKGNA